MNKLKQYSSNRYIDELKKIVMEHFRDENVRVYLFGSRAREDNSRYSDIDIAILFEQETDRTSMTFLKEKIENLNIPYKVDLIDMNEVSGDFKKEIMKEAVVWKG